MNENAPTKDVVIIRRIFARIGSHKAATTLVIAAIVLGLWMTRGIYMVRTNETAALLRFGKVVDDAVGPGLHFHWPSPVEKVSVKNTTEVKRLTLWTEDYIARSGLLTGDENIIHLTGVVQYKISNLDRYLFGAKDWDRLIRAVTESVFAEETATFTIDDVLTVGKSRIQNNVRVRVQRILDQYRSGVTILSTTLQAVKPPTEASDAFRKVADARSESAKLVNEAQSKYKKELSMARGRSEQILLDAQSTADEITKKAQAEANKFAGLYAEYKKAKTVTRKNYYLSAMEEILSKTTVNVVDPKSQKKIQLNISPTQK